jgi:hypothetical protein
VISWGLGLTSRDAKVPSQNKAGGFRNLFGPLRFLVDIGRTLDLFCLVVAVLATVSREPGQALTGAAISGVALCEGRLHRTKSLFRPQCAFRSVVCRSPATHLTAAMAVTSL